MIRLYALALLALIPVGGVSAAVMEPQKEIDRALLDRWRNLTVEQKQRFRERLAKFKKLPEEERERIRSNLKRYRELSPEKRQEIGHRRQKLSRQELRQYGKVASSFFQFTKNRGILRGFPRWMFFTWVKNTDPGAIERLHGQNAEQRWNSWIRLYFEFKKLVFDRTVRHVRKHKCIPADELQRLDETSMMKFWVRWRRGVMRCRSMRRSGGNKPPGNVHE